MGKFLDKFRPGDYLRELSVVILGVAVTFAGSAMIPNHTVRKNLKENMRLIKIELEKNVMKLHEAMDYIAADVHIGREMLSRDYRSIPPDTLRMYAHAISYLQPYSYTDDALEMLEASALMPDVRNKHLLLYIIRCYEAFGNFGSVMDFYNSKKRGALTYNDDKDYLVFRDGSVYDRWGLWLESDYMCEFLSVNGTIVDEEAIEAVLGEIQKVIDGIEEEYGVTDSGYDGMEEEPDGLLTEAGPAS